MDTWGTRFQAEGTALHTLQMPCGATVPGLSERPGWPWVREEPGGGSRQVKGWADLRAL